MRVALSAMTCSLSVCTRRDLPIPASPLSNTTCPSPPLACAHRSRSKPTSRSLPTSGVRPVLTATSNRFCASLSRTTRYNDSGRVIPFNVCGPRSWHSNKPATNRCVTALSTTVLGSATPWMRAARLGVSPKASCSARLPAPISPTTTNPV
jgi:hypothetical protein